MLVYVTNRHGKPLMPCKPAKARHLLKDGRARVIRMTPFTIQLIYGSSGYTQPVTLGVDAGSKTIGLSASTESRVLFEAEAGLRNDIKELLAGRREARRTRRNRKTRYRKPRFSNRKNRKDRMPPSVEEKAGSHLEMVKLVNKILPVKTVVIETASFDIQKIKDPDIEGTGYQQGEMLGFWNVREYVLWRDRHECQCCHGRSRDPVLNVHHIESRKKGSDRPENLVTLCGTCHDRYHKGRIGLPENIQKPQEFRDAAFMTTMRWHVYRALKELYPDVRMTYGYITKNMRIENGLPKSHIIDARCIAGHPDAYSEGNVYQFKKIRRHNRKLYKDKTLKGGKRKRNQCPYEVFGFHRYDAVMYGGRVCYINSLRTSGHFQVKSLSDKNLTKEVSYKKLKLVEICRGWLKTAV